MIYREGTNDATSMVRDLAEYGAVKFEPGCTVLDLGGHIGLFAVWCYAYGARRVVSVEPEPDNCRVHRLNTARTPQHLLVQAACVGSDELTVDLYVNRGRNKGRHSLRQFEGSEPVKVAAAQFDDLLRFVRPDFLKVDVEGSEYEYCWDNLISTVRNLAVEFHDLPELAEPRARVERCLAQQGFVDTYTTQEARSYILRCYER